MIRNNQIVLSAGDCKAENNAAAAEKKTAVKNRRLKRIGGNDKLFYILNGFLLALLAVIVIYPLYFIVIASFSNPDALLNGEVFLYPKGISFNGYIRLINESRIWRGYSNTVLYTAAGTALNIAVTIPAGWALSRKKLPLRGFFNWFFLITMFFGGGLVPFYNLISSLKLLDNPLSLILPGAVSVWNLFMCKAFFMNSIQDGIVEAAEIDGAGHTRTFFNIILPISKAIIAVMVLFYAVGHWNTYFNALIFLRTEKYSPLQLILHDILIQTEQRMAGDATTMLEMARLAAQLKYTSVIVATLPILIVYPFVQKFFAKGVMIGSLKG